MTTWAIDEEHATHSDHEVVTWEAEEDENRVYPSITQEHNGWSISELLNDEERRDQAAAMWRRIASLRGNLEEKRARINEGATISKEEIEEEATCIQETITEVMNSHARKLSITARSKRWWKPEISETRKKLSQAKKHLRQLRSAGEESTIQEATETVKENQRALHRQIRRSKRETWHNFLQSASNKEVWMATRYTKDHTPSTISGLRDTRGDIATTLEQKDKILRATAFPLPPADEETDPLLQVPHTTGHIPPHENS
ncbi:hypothetical protein EX30DRAFT_270940 [Ascodesmis nigricans]|uniref:Uncharacterized protein n=1 Tax=Ascodesmis nigricans TaxID=341454 RepID=A0A4S2MX88_9PEZI|nr:hypothetical protein EX30DRAFT_270940 [Ascodesmis nigricans]